MALESAFHALHVRLLDLQEALTSLRLTVVEDLPEPRRRANAVGAPHDAHSAEQVPEERPLLVQLLADHIDAISGLVIEAIKAAGDGERAVRRHPDLERARRALARCHARHNAAAVRFASDLVRYETIAQLTRLGRERGREWRAWASCVKDALEACRQPLYDVNDALVLCWQEIAERVGMSSISLSATGIRTSTTAPVPREDELLRTAGA
jgi:hypothetical protein